MDVVIKYYDQCFFGGLGQRILFNSLSQRMLSSSPFMAPMLPCRHNKAPTCGLSEAVKFSMQGDHNDLCILNYWMSGRKGGELSTWQGMEPPDLSSER